MRVLGIDLGSTSVKAVEIETAFRRIEVREYFEEKIEPTENQINALSRLLNHLPQKPDRIVVKLKPSKITFRNLHLPTRDKKSIESAITFELEDELPFNLEDCIYDHCILSQSKLGTTVHIEVTLKKYISEILENLSDIQVEPDILTSEVWSYRRIFDHILNETEKMKPIMVAHIGNERTSFYVHHLGKPILLREINFGGNDLTKSISKKYNVPIDEAEKAKLDSGFVLSSALKKQATTEQIEFSEILSKALTPFYIELRKTNLAFKSISRESVSHIFLSGGGGLLPGLRQSLEDVFNIPTTLLTGLGRINPSGGVTYTEETEAHFSLAAGTALCGVNNDKKQSIDFRKSIFKKTKGTGKFNLSQLRSPLIAGATVVFSLLISLGIQSKVYQFQIKDVDAKLRRGIRTIFPLLGNRAVKTYLSSPDRLKKAIDGEVRKQREIANLFGENSKSPVSFLKKLSTKIPKRINLDLIRFSVGAAPEKEDLVKLVFLLKTKSDINILESRLKDIIDPLEKQQPKTVKMPDGSEQRWQITFKGKPKEAAYE